TTPRKEIGMLVREELEKKVREKGKCNQSKGKIKDSYKKSRFFTTIEGGSKGEVFQIKTGAEGGFLSGISILCDTAGAGFSSIFTALATGKHLIQDRQVFFLFFHYKNSGKRFLQKEITKKKTMSKELLRTTKIFH
ncbi:hypothetical protein, partial [Persephonella sp.]